MLLMFVIQGGLMRFGQLKRALSYYGANAYKTTNELEKHNLIERKNYKTVRQ